MKYMIPHQPAPVQNHRPIHNLLVRPSPHHIVIKDPHPLAPPEHKKPQKNLKTDPFLVSEEELKGRDFSDPFWYPLEPNIVKGYRKEAKEGPPGHPAVRTSSEILLYKNCRSTPVEHETILIFLKMWKTTSIEDNLNGGGPQ